MENATTATSKAVINEPLSIYYHTHWDREWYLPFREYQHRLLKVVDGILDAVESGALECFTLDGQTVLLEDYLAFRPQNRERLETLIRSERLSIGPWYVMPDEFLISGESMIRNLARGLKISRAFGESTFTGYLPDTFGHTADVPMLLKQFDIDSAIVWRGILPDTPWFWWKSPSGDRVLGYHLTEGYFQNVFHMGESETEKIDFLKNWHEKVQALAGLEQPILFPVGADHLGFVPESPELMKEWVPKGITVTPDTFMQGLSKAEQEKLPVYTGELRDHTGAYILPGVFSSRMYLKQWNRRMEWRLTRQLEPLLSWLSLLGKPLEVSPELDFLWQTLMLNHPHDSICGCSVDSVHRENEQRFEQIDQLSGALVRDAHAMLQTQFQAENQWLILNLGDVPYTGVVEVTRDYPLKHPLPEKDPKAQLISETTLLDESFLQNVNILPLSENKVCRRTSLIWVEDIPAQGLQTLSKLEQPSDTVFGSSTHLENSRIKLSVQTDGTLQVTDKQTDTTYTGLHRWIRNEEQGDSYNAAPVFGKTPENAVFETSELMMEGPLRANLKLKHRFQAIDMPVETEISLDAGSPRINFVCRFTNQQPDHKIQAVFESTTPIEAVVAEGQFSPITRAYDPEYRIEQAMPAPRLKELLVQAGAIQRFIGFNQQTLITQGLCEYEVEGQKLKLTMLRAFGMLSRDDTQVRGSHAGPPLPTPEGQCLNRPAEYRYAWLPGFDLNTAYAHADWVYGAVYGFDRQVAGEQADPTDFTLGISWNNPNIRLSALTPTQTGSQLRLFNPTAQQQAVHLCLPPNVTASHQVNLAGRVIASLAKPELLLLPYELQTIDLQLQ